MVREVCEGLVFVLVVMIINWRNKGGWWEGIFDCKDFK